MNTVLQERHKVRSHRQAPVLTAVKAKGSVAGLLFELEVEQHFVNAGGLNIEAVYTFPLPCGAVLLGMECVIGDRVLHGSVVAKAKAQEGYEGAIEAGDTAIMLERTQGDIYTVNIGNLLAGETAVVRFRYGQLLSFEQGRVRLAIPTVIAPRYGSPLKARLAPHQVPDTDLLTEYPLELTVSLHGEVAGGRVSSPSHMLSLRQRVDALELALAGAAYMDRDFVLVIDELAGKSLAVCGDDGAGSVVLASFCPDTEQAEPLAPMAVKILLDCSGSMQGNSIDSARRALHEVLSEMRPVDRFTFSRFGNDVIHHNATLQAAESMAIRNCSSAIGRVRADMGGTNMRLALLDTFALCQGEAADILLVTDGDIWETEQLIADAERVGQRIFAVGIGAAPAASLLRALAEATGGACEFIGENDDVHAAIVRMARRMRQPRIGELDVQWSSWSAWRHLSGNAVFVGETVHAWAGFGGAPACGATLSWLEHGERRSLALGDVSSAVPGSTLARMAAAVRLESVEPEQREALALHYQLVSDCTSFLITHARPENEGAMAMPVLRKVDHMAVAGKYGASAQPNFEMKQPAVWRREWTSEQFRCMERNGPDDYDVPTFLRKASDVPTSYTHRADLIAFMQMIEQSGRAVTWNQLEVALPNQVVTRLQAIIAEGAPAQEVVDAFIIAMGDCMREVGLGRRILASLQILMGTRTVMRKVRLIVREAFNELPETCDIPAFLRKQAD